MGVKNFHVPCSFLPAAVFAVYTSFPVTEPRVILSVTWARRTLGGRLFLTKIQVLQYGHDSPFSLTCASTRQNAPIEQVPIHWVRWHLLASQHPLLRPVFTAPGIAKYRLKGIRSRRG